MSLSIVFVVRCQFACFLSTPMDSALGTTDSEKVNRPFPELLVATGLANFCRYLARAISAVPA
jgi:hypothetical protein